MISGYRKPGLTGMIVGAALLGCLAVVGLTRPVFAAGETPAAVPVVQAGLSTDTVPAGWHKNGTPATLGDYTVGVDRGLVRDGKPSAFVRTSSTESGFGGMMQAISAKAYRGKRVRYSAWMRTSKVARGAHLWLRVDGEKGKMLQLDNMDSRELKGDNDWTRCVIVLDVPNDAEALVYGMFLSQSGQMWVNGLALEEAAFGEPSTNRLDRENTLPKAPVNLGFE